MSNVAAQPLEKQKIVVIAIVLVILVVTMAFVGSYIASKLALHWLHIDMQPKITTIFDLLQQLSSTTAKKAKGAILGATALGALIALSPLLFAIIVFIAARPREELYGSARFARDFEIRQAGYLPTPKELKQKKYPSILIGQYKNNYLHYSGQQFLYLDAPTRSGKGVGIIIPNLLNYRDSVVVVDIKFENFLSTAGYRQKCGQEVYLFSPDGYAENEQDKLNGTIKSHHYNPLHYIRRDMKYRDGDVQKIVDILFPPNSNDIWKGLAGNFAKGLICYLLDVEHNLIKAKANNANIEVIEPTIPQMMKLGIDKGGYSGFIERALKEHDDSEMELSEATRAAFSEFLEMHDKGRSSVLMTFNAEMKVYTNPTCAAALSGNDFDFADLRKKRMSVYVGLTPDGLKTYSRLINLFFSQLIMANTQTLPKHDSSLKYQVLLVLDEFPALGAVNILADSIGFTAGYNLRYLMIVQDHSQLCSNALYGKERADNILKNCAVRLIYPPKEVDAKAESISKTLGYKTIKRKERGRSSSGGKITNSTNDREHQRALMLPQEVVDLGTIRYKKTDLGIKEIVIAEKVKPFIADKIIYFDQAVFQRREAYALKNIPTIPLLFNNISNRSE